MSQDFQKGKIYKITNDYNDDVYVGSTCDILVKRFSFHKRDRNSPIVMNRPLYSLMNEIGCERFRIELIENFPCEDKYQLRQREGFFIREIGTLNKRIEGRTRKEYNKDNAHIKKKYREEHQEKIKEYRLQNAEKKKELNKEWREKNADKIKEYNNGTTICECGCEISKNNLLRHKKSEKHKKLLNEKLAI